MTRYKDSLDVARRSFEVIAPWLGEKFCDSGRYVLTDKGRMSRVFQERFGDVIAQRNGEMVTIELKAEEKTTGNYFIEDWSNWSKGNPGWLHKLDADLLLYHFLDSEELHIISFQQLKAWLFSEMADGPGNRMARYRLVRQWKCDQRNDTWGRLVPVEHIRTTSAVRSHIVYFGTKVDRDKKTWLYSQEAMGF